MKENGDFVLCGYATEQTKGTELKSTI